MNENYEQMELDTRRNLDIALENLTSDAVHTAEQMIMRYGEAPSAVRNRHEAYGIAAERFAKIRSAVKTIEKDTASLLGALPDPNYPAIEAVSSICNSTLAATAVLIDGTEFLRMPYYFEDGKEAATRKRYGHKEFRWMRGSKGKICLYGEWRLPEIQKKGWVILVEGESDTQTLWYLGFPAIGIAGASMFKPHQTMGLQNLKIYIHKEPDSGGDTFYRKVTHALADTGFSGEVYVWSCRSLGKKDPSDVYLANGREEAARLIREALRRAKAVDLEAEMRQEPITGAPISLRTPEGWLYSDKGISWIDPKTHTPANVCRTPVILTQRLKSLETGDEKIEIAFKRDDEWQSAIYPRSVIFSSRSITALADLGCTITSENSKNVVKFLGALEAENIDLIPKNDATSTFGWQPGRRFIPGFGEGITLDIDPSQRSMAAAYCQNGTMERWIEHMRPHRSRDRFRFILAASFAAPLLRIVKQRIFFVYNWGGSKGGKTAALKAALSAWGDPERLMVNFNATMVGLERTASFYCDLPLGIDERQLAGNNQGALEKIVYMIANGTGKLRGAKTGGIQTTHQWRTVALATGEEPLSTETTQTGVSTRVLEIYGGPFDNEQEAAMMHQQAAMDCGWAGPEYIRRMKTTIGEEFNPELQALAEIATDVLTVGNEFMEKHPALVKAAMTFVGVVGLATAGITAYVAVTKVAAALNLASMFTVAGPVMLAVGAVAGLTAGIVALVAATDDGIPSVKELTEAAREMEDVMGQAGDAYGQTAEGVQAAADVADIYINKLEALDAGTSEANGHSREYLNTLALLCNAVPELAGYVDLETGAIEGGTEALRAHTEAWKKDAQEQARQDYLNELYSQYNGVMKEAAANSIKLTEAQIKLENAQKGRESAQTRMNQLQAEMNARLDAGKAATAEQAREYNELEAALIAYNGEIYEAQEQVDAYSEAVDADNAAMAQAQAEFDAAAEAMDRLTGATDDQAEAQAELTAQTDALGNSISGAAEELRALAEEYGDAYNAAYESVSGQYALWDEAAEVAATSAGDINSALEGQAAYWRDYNANLASLAERADDIDGLREVIASFADGSAESVNAIAGMAKANDDDLAAMVKNWQDVQTEWNTTADSLAKLQTDFDTRMGEIVAGVEEDISSMDFSEEAAAAARSTIASYIGVAEEQLPEVERAYGDLARAARSALMPDAAGRTTGPVSVQAYASGTESAMPGAALVGEEGPELVYFGGGERVMDAARTSAILNTGGGAAPVSIQVSFQLGNASPETAEQLRSAGDEIAGRIREVVEDVLDRREEELVRRRY